MIETLFKLHGFNLYSSDGTQQTRHGGGLHSGADDKGRWAEPIKHKPK